MARALAERGHQVDLIFGCLDAAHLPPDQFHAPEVPGVNVQVWDRSRVAGMFLPLCRYFRDVKPDIVFSAEDHLNDMVILAALVTRSKAKLSGSSRVFPYDQIGHEGPYSEKAFSKGWIFKQVTRVLLKRADAMTCVSEDMAETYRTIFPHGRHECVHNIIADDRAQERMKEPVEHPWFGDQSVPLIVSAGTLTLRKGFTDLLRALRIVHDRGHRVRLAILGEGPMREELAELTKELKLEGFVWMPGRVDNTLKYFARGDVSVLCSYSEGLPNALVEAMVCGCVPVATDCPTGPREVLQNGKYGYLVPMRDPPALAAGIIEALERPIAPELLQEAVRSFQPDAVIGRHFGLLGISAA
jgi:glycosyltransferase involved in cell wall biosynthesis